MYFVASLFSLTEVKNLSKSVKIFRVIVGGISHLFTDNLDKALIGQSRRADALAPCRPSRIMTTLRWSLKS